MKEWQSLNPDKITSEGLRKYLFTGKFNRIFENHLKAGQMKYFNFIILTAVICIIIIPCGYCQNSQYGFDTIHILKQKRNRNIYQFIDSGSLEIQYSISDPKHLGGRMGLGNAGNGFLTILTGINFAT